MQNKQYIPYQSNEQAFIIRKIRANFDAVSIGEQPHRHEFTEFLYIKSGKGKHEIDGIEYNLTPDTFYIISKGQVHNFLYASDIEGILIRFNDSILPAVHSSKEGFYYNLIFALRNYNELPIKKEDSQLIDLLLNRMLIEYQGQISKVIDLSLIQHLLYPIIILLNKQVSANIDAQDHQQDQFSKFINLLEKSFKQHRHLQFYANELGLPPRKLTEICQSKSGKTAKKIINERVITGAKRLMKYTTLPLKEIAHSLGYKDLGYFCRYFKKATGKTPTEYKNG